MSFGQWGLVLILVVVIVTVFIAFFDHQIKRDELRAKQRADERARRAASNTESSSAPDKQDARLELEKPKAEKFSDFTSARDLLFHHIAQERANLEARGATAEELNFVDQFAARLSARFDQER